MCDNKGSAAMFPSCDGRAAAPGRMCLQSCLASHCPAVHCLPAAGVLTVLDIRGLDYGYKV